MSNEEIDQLYAQKPLSAFYTLEGVARLLGYGLEEPEPEPDDSQISTIDGLEREEDDSE